MNPLTHSKSRTLLRLLIALALVCFGLSARAANISADPAEVFFYVKSPTMKKSTTITWNAEAQYDPVGVYVTATGSGENLMALGLTGQKTANFIMANNTYEFCLWGNDHSVKLKCVTVTTKVAEFDFSVALGFIHNVVVTPRGNSVKISFTTDRTAAAFVQVSDKAPKAFPIISKEDVAAFNPQDVVSTSLPSIKSSHSIEVPKLEPGKDFFYVIAANDKQNHVWWKLKGKFRTLQRKVSVTFEKIKIVDDSDDHSPGDLLFGFFINGQNAPNGKAMTFGTHASTDSTKTSNITGSVVGAPTTLALKAIGYDDDGEEGWIPIGPFVAVFSNGCGTGDVTNPSTTEGEDDCGEWTSGSKSFDLKAITANVSNIEDFTQSFTINGWPQGDDSEVSFRVTGTFRVRYVP